jgi:hypothetical protein
MVAVEKALEIINQVFSEEGYQTEKFKIKATFPVEMHTEERDGGIEVTFKGNLPVVTASKRILGKKFTMSFGLIGIIITKKDGLIKLDKFPDIPFKVK